MSAPGESFDTFGNFADGHSAVWHRVGVALDPAESPVRLRITLPDGQTVLWPFSGLRQVPDQADTDALVLSLAGNPVARLSLRDEACRQTIRRSCRNLRKRPRPQNTARLLGWAGAALASVAAIIFVLVPLMADQLAEYLPPEGEQALGDATFEQIREALGDAGFNPVRVCEAPDGIAALDAMQVRLNPFADLPYPIRVNVLDHDMVNAFALPGGRIVLFRGLIEAAETPEEVGAVLAHEIGHVVGRDPTRDALRSAGSIGVLGLLFGDFAGGTVVLFLANQLINASYSQNAETAADTYAHDLLLEADLSPAALGTMFQRLRDKYGDAEGIVAHFASHPQLQARIEASLAAAEPDLAVRPMMSGRAWQALQTICGGSVPRRDLPVVPGDNVKTK